MEQINFYAEDGTKLNGFLHKSKETTQDVILSIHGMSSNCFKERDNVIANTANNLNIDYEPNDKDNPPNHSSHDYVSFRTRKQ